MKQKKQYKRQSFPAFHKNCFKCKKAAKIMKKKIGEKKKTEIKTSLQFRGQFCDN